MRILLCSLAVPWPSRPRLGIFHLHQARAIAERGGAVRIFAPGPQVPDWLGRRWKRVRDHAERPARYEVDDVQIDAPRVRFAFPPLVRRGLAQLAPDFVLRWADRAIAPALDAAIDSFRPDVILAHGIVPWGRVAVNAAHRHGIRCAFIEHSADDVFRLRPASRLGRAVSECARATAHTFVVGAPMRDWLSRTMGWRGVELLPNGASLAGAPPPPRPASLDGRFVILAAANYYRRKGLEELVAAFDVVARAHVDAELHLVTPAPRGLLRRIERTAHRDRIRVHPPMDSQALLGWMAWADLFALPSWREAFGLVYAEALAAGTPVLATTDSGFACEAQAWAASGRTAPASIVPPRDHTALVHELDHALRSRDELAAMARSGAELVNERFTWDHNAKALLAALDQRCDTNDDAGRPAAFSRVDSSAAPKA